MMEKVFEALAASGPVALVLGIVCWKLWEQNAAIRAELSLARTAFEEKNDRLQAKMLRLAVRVQRAVEALAGLEVPEVETLLDDDEEPDEN